MMRFCQSNLKTSQKKSKGLLFVLVFFDSSPFWEKQPRFKNNENKEE
jgi:hypothetical protein